MSAMVISRRESGQEGKYLGRKQISYIHCRMWPPAVIATVDILEIHNYYDLVRKLAAQIKNIHT